LEIGEGGITMVFGVGGTSGQVIAEAGSTIIVGLEVPEINTGDNINKRIPTYIGMDFNGRYMLLVFPLSFGL
jgi:hypothetical protein